MASNRSGLEAVVVKRCPFMRSERESDGFLQCKVHRLAVGMGSYGVSEVGS